MRGQGVEQAEGDGHVDGALVLGKEEGEGPGGEGEAGEDDDGEVVEVEHAHQDRQHDEQTQGLS